MNYKVNSKTFTRIYKLFNVSKLCFVGVLLDTGYGLNLGPILHVPETGFLPATLAFVTNLSITLLQAFRIINVSLL